MTTETVNAIENFAAISTRTVEAYNMAGKTLVAAYRDGVKRVVLGFGERHAEWRAQRTRSVVSEQVRDQLIDTRKEFNDLIIQRVEADAKNTMTVMDRVAVAATSGIDSAIGYMHMIESPALRGLINGAITLHMPVAQLSAQVADQLVDATQRLEARVNGSENESDGDDTAVAKEAKAQSARRTRKAV